MTKIQVQIKSSFGKIVLEGENHIEILETLRSLPPDFLGEINNLISTKLTPSIKSHLEGIIEFTTEGPIITTRKKLTHYEAIGIILYASEGKNNTAAQIDRLLESSGIKSMVPARLNEMTKRRLIFKPNPARPEFKLTTQGEQWIKEKVLSET